MEDSAIVAHAVSPLLGVATGFRSFTPIATTAWFARLGKLDLEGTWAAGIGHPAAVGILTVAAIGECIGDKLPHAPNRTMPVAVAGRLIFGGLVGAIVATAFRRPVAGGIALGALGAAAGTFGGFYGRKGMTGGTGLEDVPVALAEDVMAVGIAIGVLERLNN